MANESRLDSYREQHGCHDCPHVFEYFEYDEGTTYYCTLGAPPRPKSLSVLLRESALGGTYADYSKATDAWVAWREGREVAPWGWCDEFGGG